MTPEVMATVYNMASSGGILTRKSWIQFFSKNTRVPAALDREHAAHDISTPICIAVKSVVGLTSSPEQTDEYQVSLTLYDTAFRQFFGRQWQGPKVASKGAKLQYNKSVYMHTSMNNGSIVAVVEVVAHRVTADGRPCKVSCGWGLLRPFSSDLSDLTRGAQPRTQKVQLYHGTPRALYFLDEPVESNQLLRSVEGCELSIVMTTNKAMMAVMHLMPENTLLDSQDIIPGLAEAAGSDKFKDPQLQQSAGLVIDGLVVHLQPNVDKFEEELCDLLREDRSLQRIEAQDSLFVTVVERRLQVGVHNGWCYIEKPNVFHLEKQATQGSKKPISSPSLRRSARYHIRHNSTGSPIVASNESVNLVLKSRINVNELLADPLCSVVFTLEYVIGEPLTVLEKRQSQSLARTHTRTISIRWASWNPFMQPDVPEVTMPLLGGPHHSPDEALVYKVPSTSMQNESTAFSAGGLLAFRWAREGEMLPSGSLSLAIPAYQHLGSAVSVRSDASEAAMLETRTSGGSLSRKPPMAKPRLPPSTATQGGLMLGASAAPIPQYAYPMGPLGLAPITSAQHQNIALGNMFPYMQAPAAGLHPIDIMHMHEASAMTELKDLPFTPVHALVLAPGPQPRGGRGLSRAAYARLFSAGFPPLLDRNGEPPEVVDPHGQHLVSLTREQADPLQANEIIFQFLAYSREPSMNMSHAESPGQPATVFFSFQFYRFPQVTTERMLLSKAQNDLSSSPNAVPFILQRLNPDGTVMEGPPGLEIKYPVDPTYLKPGEIALFWQHLARQTIHIDVWDGDSLLLIGSCAVELKYLFRGGNEAVQTTFELDVLTTEYQEDSGALTGEIARSGSVRPVGVNCLNRGRLHFRMANVGYPIDKKQAASTLVPSKTQVIVSQTAGNSSYKGGSLTTLIPPQGTKKVRVARAKHLAENREVASLLFSDQRKLESAVDEEIVPREGDAERQRKLARFQAVKTKENTEEDNKAFTTVIGYRRDKADRTRDFKTMDIYRNQTKREGITSMLSTSITTEHVIFSSFGTAEFFEFMLRNPFNKEETFTIEVTDPELHLITDAREWRHYKQLCQLNTPLEEGMFTSASADKNKPQIFLRPKETVYIPLKFQTFQADMSVQPQGPSNPLNKTSRQSQHDRTQDSRVLRVLFRSEEGKAVAILNVRVDPQPHVIDQTFRFYHPENSFLKKSVRLPPFNTLPGAPVGGTGMWQLYVKSSDPNVILDCKPTQPGEPHDIFMKVALGASPQIKRFFVCAYVDPFLSRPAQIWQCYVHALQRVDVTCVEGQSSHVSLLLKGTQASRVVKCFTSHPQELQIAPRDPFILAAGTAHELSVAVRPLRTGSKFFYLNVVDIEYHQLVRSWLLCASCRSPIVSRAFELTLPVGGGKSNSKRITYTNPYPVAKRFHLLCDRSDLLQFKESILEINAGDSHTIGMRFMPVMQPGAAEILVFINDEEDKNEETFRITATYKFL